MRKPLIYCIAVTTLLTTGCSSTEDRRGKDPSFWDKFSIVHTPEIQQGNIINQEMVNKLRPGMDKRKVQFVMGTPLLVDVFHQDQWDYFYSLAPSEGDYTEQHLALYFEEDRLIRIQGDLRPMPTDDLPPSEEVVVSVPDYEGGDKGIITIILEKLRFGADW